MKIQLKLEKSYEIDTDRDWDGDTSKLVEVLRDEIRVEPGQTASFKDIEDAVKHMLSEDFEYVVDLDLSEEDFVVTVAPEVNIEIPEEEEDED